MLAVVLIAAGTPASTQTTQSSPTPEARWHLKSIPGQCTLTGQRTPDNVGLYIQAIPGTEYYRLAISGHDFGPQKPDETSPIKILFHDKDARFDTYALSVPFPDGSGWLIRVDGLRADMLQALARASSISFERKGASIGPFAFQNADEAVAKLGACIANQLIAWGADPAQFELGGARPVELKDSGEWIPRGRYLSMARFLEKPPNMLSAVLRISISNEGRVDGCARVEGPTEPDFEKMACRLVLSQRLFRPAHDPNGKPVRGAAAVAFNLRSPPVEP